MGRKPSNGGPSFRFNNSEVAEMESILQANDIQVPGRDELAALAKNFSSMPERMDKGEVQIKQVWNWFQNRRYALRAKAGNLRSVLHSIRPNAAPSVQGEPNNVPENPLMEFEARSARDGAWYDVACFLSHRSLDTGAPEVYVRFAGFGPEEDEWLNVRKHIRQRSLPCESSECVAVLPGDLILCFQEGKEQALYFDAHVLDSQRRRHDARGCRCRFLVRYDHDQSEEIVPLRKICRRPETDYRLQQLHAEAAKVHQQRAASDIHFSSLGKGHAAAEPRKEQIKVDTRAGNTIGQTIGDLTLGTHSPSVNTPMINFNPDIPQLQHATETPLGTVATEMLPATDTQTFRPACSYPEVSLEITQAVGQVPAIPQAESSQPAGLLELIGSQDMEETGPEGHKDTKEILETTQLQYPAEQIMPAAEGHDIGLCASATPTQASLLELTDTNMESGER